MKFLAVFSMLLLTGCGAISNMFSQVSNWGNESMPTYDGSRPAAKTPPPTMQQQQNLREFDNMATPTQYPNAPQSAYTPPIADQAPQGYYPQSYQQPQQQYQPQVQQPYYGQQAPVAQQQPYYPSQPQLQQIYPPAQAQAPQQYQYPQQGYAPQPQRPADDFPSEYGSAAKKSFFEPGNQPPQPFPPTPTR